MGMWLRDMLRVQSMFHKVHRNHRAIWCSFQTPNHSYNMFQTISSMLSSAWESIKSLASAAGVVLDAFNSFMDQPIVRATLAAGIVIGSIALAPTTGGGSLAGLALFRRWQVYPSPVSQTVRLFPQTSSFSPSWETKLTEQTSKHHLQQCLMRSTLR